MDRYFSAGLASKDNEPNQTNTSINRQKETPGLCIVESLKKNVQIGQVRAGEVQVEDGKADWSKADLTWIAGTLEEVTCTLTRAAWVFGERAATWHSAPSRHVNLGASPDLELIYLDRPVDTINELIRGHEANGSYAMYQ